MYMKPLIERRVVCLVDVRFNNHYKRVDQRAGRDHNKNLFYNLFYRPHASDIEYVYTPPPPPPRQVIGKHNSMQ